MKNTAGGVGQTMTKPKPISRLHRRGFADIPPHRFCTTRFLTAALGEGLAGRLMPECPQLMKGIYLGADVLRTYERLCGDKAN